MLPRGGTGRHATTRFLSWLGAGIYRGLTACLCRSIRWRRKLRGDLRQDLDHDCPRYNSSDLPNVFVVDTGHPCTNGRTPAVETCARMSLRMPWEQDMIIRQRLGQPAGNSNDSKRVNGCNTVVRGNNHCRAQLPDAIGVRNFCPDNPTKLYWPRHRAPCLP